MPQYLKEEVGDRIADAALAVFAEHGYAAATMAQIAARADLSVGNLYRYHTNKEALFDAVVPESFVTRLRALLRRRIESLAGTADVQELAHPERAAASAAFGAAAEELLAFTIEHRLRVVVALGRARGSRHEGLADELVQLMKKLAIAHFRALSPGLVVSEALRFDLELVYRNLVDATVAILARFEDGAKIRQAVTGYSTYHLAGLARLFGSIGERALAES